MAALAVVLAAQGALSLALRLRSVHERLRERLEQAFGRPVEVGRFDVSVWSGLRLEAHYITVAEDPKFGAEFVLRADGLSASPDLRALLSGRLLLYRFSFERPSMNLVRDREGRWNLESWPAALRTLGPPAGAIAGRGGSAAGRVEGLLISHGRINFKHGADKLPFALVDVNGDLAPASDGRWRITLEAQPLRAGVTLQDAGTLRFSGTLPAAALSSVVEGGAAGGPAEFSFEWGKASLSDALRLIAGEDYGVRGSLDVSFSAQTPPHAGRDAGPNLEAPPTGAAEGESGSEDGFRPAWQVSGRLRLADVHRWDLPVQPGLPGLNASFNAVASADRREWRFREVVLEARRSNLRGSASLRLGPNRHAAARVVTAGLHLDDLLAWYRAFHTGVRPGTWVDGYLGADVELTGWPLKVVHGTLATTGARLNVAGEKQAIELGRAVVEADAKGARLRDARLAVGDEDAGVHLAGSTEWAADLPFQALLTGSTDHLAEVSTALAALGLVAGPQPLRAEGSVTARLGWKGTAHPWRAVASGTVSLDDVTLAGGALRSSISAHGVRLEFQPAQRRVDFSDVKAFGAVWNGTLRAPTLSGPWQFALSADRLNPAAIARGFVKVPEQNQGLLSRLLPPQAASTIAQQPNWPEWLRGEGTVTVGALAVRLSLERVKGTLTVGERQLELDGGEAAFYGGRVRGSARAAFGEQPRYSVLAQFDGVDVASLAAVTVSARQCCTGTASGGVELTAHGWDRDALFASLEGKGHADVRSAALLTLDLAAASDAAAPRAGRSALRSAAGDFSLTPSELRLDRLSLDAPPRHWEGQGAVSYRGELNVTMTEGARGPSPAPEANVPPRTVAVTGTLASPLATPRAPSQ